MKVKDIMYKASNILGNDWKYHYKGQEFASKCESMHSRIVKYQRETFDQWIRPMLYLDYQYYTSKDVLRIEEKLG